MNIHKEIERLQLGGVTAHVDEDNQRVQFRTEDRRSNWVDLKEAVEWLAARKPYPSENIFFRSMYSWNNPMDTPYECFTRGSKKRDKRMYYGETWEEARARIYNAAN